MRAVAAQYIWEIEFLRELISSSGAVIISEQRIVDKRSAGMFNSDWLGIREIVDPCVWISLFEDLNTAGGAACKLN